MLIATNVLSTLQRSHFVMTTMDRALTAGADIYQGDSVVLLLLTASAFREALDAFDDAKHLFKKLPKGKARQAFDRLVAAISTKKSDPASFYMRVVTHYRVTGGFHWDRASIERLLSNGTELLSGRMFSAPVSPSIDSPSRYVVGDEVLAEITLGGEGKAAMRKDFAELRDLIGSFFRAVETMIAHHMLERGCTQRRA